MPLAAWCRGLVFLIVAAVATRAHAYAVGPAEPLAALAKRADLVCKATVVGERVVTDPWFAAISGFEVRETELRVVGVLKGPRVQRVRFRHYTPASGPAMYAPQHYTLARGRTYVVFAAKHTGGAYRQLAKAHTQKEDAGVLPAPAGKLARRRTITETVLAELRAMLASARTDDVVAAIAQLDELSGGAGSDLRDFPRDVVLAALRPLIASGDAAVAEAAIAVVGADSPYLDDAQAPYWLAGIGKGTIPGLAGRKPTATDAKGAVAELLATARSHGSAHVRGLAIRALGKTGAIPAPELLAWSREREPAVRRAAVLVSAEHPDRRLITPALRDPDDGVRAAAALAIGFAQDPALLPQLDALLKDKAATVRQAAAMSVLAFAPADAKAVLAANLGGDYRALFVNALARHDPQPYLALLGEVIARQLQPAQWWGGMIPAGDSWQILFAYVKARPTAELVSGKLDGALDALERMRWYSSSEPRDLYALYVRRNLPARAQRFRAAMRKAVTYDIDYYFDMADKDPAAYVP